MTKQKYTFYKNQDFMKMEYFKKLLILHSLINLQKANIKIINYLFRQIFRIKYQYYVNNFAKKCYKTKLYKLTKPKNILIKQRYKYNKIIFKRDKMNFSFLPQRKKLKNNWIKQIYSKTLQYSMIKLTISVMISINPSNHIYH